MFLYSHEGLTKKYPILGSRTAGHGLYVAVSHTRAPRHSGRPHDLPLIRMMDQLAYMNLIRSLRAENSISFSSRPSRVSSFLALATHPAVIRR